MKSRQYAGFYVYEFLQILRTDKSRRLMRRPYREVIMRNGLTHWINKKKSMQVMSMEEKRKLTVDDFKFSQRLYLTLRRNCVKTVGDWYSSGLLIRHLGEKSGIGVQVPVTALISIMFQKPSGNFRRAFSFIIRLSKLR